MENFVRVILILKEMMSLFNILIKRWAWFIVPCYSLMAVFIRFPSYGWYEALRFLVTAEAVIFGVICWHIEEEQKEIHLLSVILFAVAVLFCPFFGIHMARSTWIIVDFVTSVLLSFGVYKITVDEMEGKKDTNAINGSENKGNIAVSCAPVVKQKNRNLEYNVSDISDVACNKECNDDDECDLWRKGYGKITHARTTEAKAEALLLIEKSAERGNVNAQYFMGRAYSPFFGYCQMVDRKKAYDWYIRAAEQDHPEAQSQIASYYEYGLEPVTKDLYKALSWYKKAASCEKIFYGDDFDVSTTREFAGKKVAELEEVIDRCNRLRHEAEDGDVDAQVKYGTKLFTGEEKGIDQNVVESINWLSKAAIVNNAQAQYELGIVYEYMAGLRDLNDDARQQECLYNEADRWFLEAEKQAYPYAKQRRAALKFVREKQYLEIRGVNQDSLKIMSVDDVIDVSEKYGTSLSSAECEVMWQNYYAQQELVDELLKAKEWDLPSSRQMVNGYNANKMLAVFHHIAIRRGWLVDYLIDGGGHYRESFVYMRREEAKPLLTKQEFDEKVGKTEEYQPLNQIVSDGSLMAYYEMSVLRKFLDGLYRYDHSWYDHDDVFVDEEWELEQFKPELVGDVDIRPRVLEGETFCVLTRFMHSRFGSYGYVREAYDKKDLSLINVVKEMMYVENKHCYY